MPDPHSVAEVVTAYEEHEPIDPWCKGVPIGDQWPRPTTVAALRDSGRSIFDGGLRTPFATLRSTALAANLAAMAAFCAEHHLLLAPHAKTAMSPQLVGAQLAAGAWGMTAALPVQVERLWAFGVHRVLLANEVADPDAMGRLGAALSADPKRELLLLVDSIDGVDLIDVGLRPHPDARVDVLIDLGHERGRTGVRSMEQLDEVARAVARSSQLRLVGVGGYEGTIGTARDPDTVGRVDAFLTALAEALTRLQGQGLAAVDQPILSAGGSVWFDRVARLLGPRAADGSTSVVLRSGCYVTHDHGLYEKASPTRADVASAPEFRPALEVWATVVSRPEAGLVLVDAGRRDLSHDAGLPRPLRSRGRDGAVVSLADAAVTALSDQHAFIAVHPSAQLRVGDLVALGISHPCTTFDRWPLLLATDDADVVVGAVRTYF
jgi:D-serine deaminase-like pyridoxal phosphate-dependent protein